MGVGIKLFQAQIHISEHDKDMLSESHSASSSTPHSGSLSYPKKSQHLGNLSNFWHTVLLSSSFFLPVSASSWEYLAFELSALLRLSFQLFLAPWLHSLPFLPCLTLTLTPKTFTRVHLLRRAGNTHSSSLIFLLWLRCSRFHTWIWVNSLA